jgi:hypothetical protein
MPCASPVGLAESGFHRDEDPAQAASSGSRIAAGSCQDKLLSCQMTQAIQQYSHRSTLPLDKLRMADCYGRSFRL